VSPDLTRRRAIGQILLLAAGFLVLVAISTASVILVNKSREDNAWVVHTVEVENQTNALLLEIRRAESAARGYLLTSGPEFLTDHRDAVAAIIPELDKLARLVSDNPVQTESVAKLRSAVEARLGQFAKEISLTEQGKRAGATALVREAAAGVTPTAIRDIADKMRIEEDRLLTLKAPTGSCLRTSRKRSDSSNPRSARWTG
jgi:CHASE3 domain sensor protein